MLTRAENELLTRLEGDAPMGRLMRENYWLAFALASQLVPGEAPMPVRLLGENYVAFRAQDGRIGFFDELCPHRRASLALGRSEGNGIRCIYHGWKLDVSGCVVEVPNQVVRPEQFAARVPVAHFPVHEAGGLAWVWLGPSPAPAFPALPFAGEHEGNSYWCVSRVPCNWLQAVEGTIDSAHVGMLHKTWMRETAKLAEHSNINIALAQPPRYETESAPYGMRAAALRQAGDGRTYVRITEYFMPLVTVVPVGRAQPRDGSMFVISPVDDTHHLLFYGYFSDTPTKPPWELGGAAPDLVPDPHDYTALRGDRSNRWGQDRELMKAGHFTGFGRTLLEEDAVVQTSMGPILDRTREHLCSSDVAVAHARRILLDALRAAESGVRPPGSALSSEPVRMPNAREALLEDGARWGDLVLDPGAAARTGPAGVALRG
jgi:phenylpropionate dioxygenase-like ring-hydroxylating dioxygenase large terminal subunit